MPKQKNETEPASKDITVAIGRRSSRSEAAPSRKSTGFAREHRAARAGITDPRLEQAASTTDELVKDTPDAGVQTKVVTPPAKPAPKSTPAQTKKPASARAKAPAKPAAVASTTATPSA